MKLGAQVTPAELKSAFEQFLGEQAPGQTLTAAQREALFQGFLKWRGVNGGRPHH
jgi:hypothetical protein